MFFHILVGAYLGDTKRNGPAWHLSLLTMTTLSPILVGTVKVLGYGYYDYESNLI